MLSTNEMLSEPNAARQRWMAALARSSVTELDGLLRHCPPLPAVTTLRPAENGMVMARGRAGGAGQAFNLGEMTVTRCSVRTGGGLVGHAYIAGRDLALARLAAVLDALLQDAAWHPILDRHVVSPLLRRQAENRAARAGKAAATQVQFFTLSTMRG